MTSWISSVNTAETIFNEWKYTLYIHSVNLLNSVKQIYSMSIRTGVILWSSSDMYGPAATDSGPVWTVTRQSDTNGSNESGTRVFTIKNRFLSESNARVGKEQATGEGRKVKWISGSSAQPPEGHHLRSEPFFGPTSKPPAGPGQPFHRNLQVMLNMNGLATGRQSYE